MPLENVDAGVVVHAGRELGPVVINRHAEKGGIDLEGFDEVESEPPGEQVVVILLHDPVAISGTIRAVWPAWRRLAARYAGPIGGVSGPESDHIGTSNGGLTMVTFAMIVVQDVQGMNDNIFKDKWKRAPFIAVN